MSIRKRRARKIAERLARIRATARRFRKVLVRRFVLRNREDLEPKPTKRGPGRRHQYGTRPRVRLWYEHPDDSLDKRWKLSPTQVKERQRANLHRALARADHVRKREAANERG